MPLGELCEAIVGGGTPDRGNPWYWGGTIPWASVKDLKSDELTSTQESITPEGLGNSATRLVESGTIVIATRMGLGKVCVARTKLAINQDLKGLILRPNVLSQYAVFFLKSRASDIEGRGTGATVKGVKLEELKAWPMPVPFPRDSSRSLDTQRRIVARIEVLLAELKEARALATAIRRNTDRIMEAALTEAVSELDCRFQLLSVSQLVEAGRVRLVGGGTPSKAKAAYWTGPIPWVSPKDMKRWLIDDAEDHISLDALSETLEAVSIPDAPLPAQGELVTHLDEVQAEVGEMRRMQAQDAELLDQLEQSILERAFRGEL
jgi:type I restriction enzyme S subunit